MGVLSTSDSSRPRLLKTLHRLSTPLCILLYPLGVCAFICLASPMFNEPTYFSDNSLLPGMVERTTNIERDVTSLLDSLEEEAASHTGIPYAWLSGQFRQAGLEVYRHNFSLSYPFGKQQRHVGENLYAMIRAPRASRTEAMVISAPYRSPSSPHGPNLVSIATMVALAKDFRKRSYWSKDIIFVITEHELVGLQAWLDAYHIVETSPGVVNPGTLEARSGNIMAAINLEIQHKKIKELNLKIFGLNGQLPNLDLVNTCRILFEHEKAFYRYEDRPDPLSKDPTKVWKHAFKSLLSQMSKQATGMPSAAHGLFHRYSIQALTLGSVGGTRRSVNYAQVGRVTEGLVRSVNNLLQRFHRSFFYYYLPVSDRYVSIAYYMGAFGILIGAVLVKAITLLLDLIDDHPTQYLTLLWKSLPLLLIVQMLGFMLFAFPGHGEQFVKQILPLNTQDSIYAFMIGCMITLLVMPFVTKRVVHPQAQSLLLLLHYLLVVGPLAMLNISLAVLVAVLTVPVVLTAGASLWAPFKLIRGIVQILVNPFVISYILLVVQSVKLDQWRVDDLSTNLKQAFDGHRRLLLFAIEDWYIYGAVNYSLLCLGFIPVWVHMWSL